MNRLWVRISLTFVGVILFIIAVPIMITISTRSFPINGPEHPDALTEEYRLTGEISGNEVAKGIFRFVAGITFIGILIGVVISRTLTAPLHQLSDSAKAIGERDYQRRVKVSGSDEIRAVGKAFNEMAEELQDAEEIRRNLLADVAHELRTPLSVIQGNLRAILDDVYELDKQEIAQIYEQTNHLTLLVNDLRELAQAEARQLPLSITEFDAVSWVKDAVEIFRPVANENNIDLRMEILGDHPVICGDRARLTQVLHNLLINAVNHTPTGGEITIQLEQDGSKFRFSLEDSGEGIEAQHLARVFDRFYRTDDARSREAGGAGLGLAIVRAIVEAHDGQVAVLSDGKDQGSTFTVVLPLSKADASEGGRRE
jgi:signal transduction histidine kinase